MGGGPDAPVQGPNLHGPRVAQRLAINPNYVHLVISYGGIVVSGNPNSPMPAWSTEAGGPLTVQQVDALTALVTSWAAENSGASQAPVANTVEAGAQVYTTRAAAAATGPTSPGCRASSRTSRASAPRSSPTSRFHRPASTR